MSVRQLGRDHNIPENRISSLHDQARRKDSRGLDWYEKRHEFESRSSDQMMASMALLETKRRLRRVEVADHAIEVIDKAIGVLSKNLDPVTVTDEDGTEHPKYPNIPIRDLALLLDRLNPLFGQPTTITLTEGRSLNVSGTPELSDGLLSGLAAFVARSDGPRQLESVAASASPLPSAPGPRQDQ